MYGADHAVLCCGGSDHLSPCTWCVCVCVEGGGGGGGGGGVVVLLYIDILRFCKHGIH